MTIKFHRHQTSKENVKEMPSLLLEKQWRVGACDEHKKLKKQRRKHRDMFLIIPSTAATAAPIQPNLSSTKDLQTCCDCCVTPSSWYPPPLQKNDKSVIGSQKCKSLEDFKKSKESNPSRAWIFFLCFSYLWEWWSQSFEDCKLNCSPCWLCRTRTPCSCFFMEVVELCPSRQYIFPLFFFFYPKQMMVSLSKNFWRCSSRWCIIWWWCRVLQS